MDPSHLPIQDDFRLRGESISRLETFVDAAFAIALTMLVISVGSLPKSMVELFEATKRIPTFGVCFVILSLFWTSHNRWSRRYGLDDTISTFLSLLLVFVMLVFVFPLRIVMSSALSFFTRGYLPADIPIQKASELQDAFLIYGIGWTALSLILWLQFRHALGKANALALDPVERIETRRDLRQSALMAAVGLLSIGMTFFCRPANHPLTHSLPGFAYCLIGVGQLFLHPSLDRERKLLGRPR